MLDWEKLLSKQRRKPKKHSDDAENNTDQPAKLQDTRTELERDHDRILFAAPTRRLADKTQVFPLERNDSVRTRLTHSHEVSNLSRSLGITLAFDTEIIPKNLIPSRNIPALLAAIGLAHDLGNPPFGHQGEKAIQTWFNDNKSIFKGPELTDAMRNDFLKFEGNAQTIRLLTRLQLTNDDYGLNLTYATLSALMKYPTPSDSIDETRVASKKHGYFQSEKEIVADVWKTTGLNQGVRHPLVYLMEACDDIAYAVLDAEDAVKKGLVSFSDLTSYLQHYGNNDISIANVLSQACKKHKEYRQEQLSPAELNDISMQMFRVYAIGQMINDVKLAFLENSDEIMSGNFQLPLLEKSNSHILCKTLKSFDKEHAYVHRTVLEVELTGYNTIRGLMDILWNGITERSNFEDVDSRRKTPYAAYAYNRISENYRRIFKTQNNGMPIRYREAQLLTDMISGMTDTYAVELLKELVDLKPNAS